MIKQIDSGRIPLKLWLDDIEEGALCQAFNIANLPFAVNHIALMPDCHQGFGMPIGAVLALDSVIIPNAVGVDIGCGMCAVQTDIKEISKSQLKVLVDEIYNQIPLGHRHHTKPQNESLMPAEYDINDLPVVSREYKSALHQLGTLGGGNHFIEIQKSGEDNIWIMLHSGSRNIGKQVADYYNRLATELNERWRSPIPKSAQLAYLPLDTKEGQKYFEEMSYCVDFALANRKHMMNKICEIFDHVLRGKFNPMPMINIAHNYAAKETHFGREAIVHRKGATLARKETTGIIPGSQGSKSYIVKGKGNPDSFMSCSHGAGRVMGRKEAQRKLDLRSEIKKLDTLGILHSLRSAKDLDEATGAYKDINRVMQNQQDLVDVLVELSPLAVIKG